MEALYLEYPYLKEFLAEVLKVDGRNVILDKTAFYPAGGGQPHDTGSLFRAEGEFRVIAVKKSDGEIVHELDKEGVKEGDSVKGVIDWARRYKLMRMHTAAHVLATVFHRTAGALITGNQLGEGQSRIDFALEDFDREKIGFFFEEANKIVAIDLKVRLYWLSREEAMQNPELFKLAAGFKHDFEKIRIVEIGEVDKQADGGCHVRSLKEIGTIEFLKAENKGKSNRRVYFTVN